jgi:hypothetical protein
MKAREIAAIYKKKPKDILEKGNFFLNGKVGEKVTGI